MGNFFYVTLDTRPPVVEIYAPPYATPDQLVRIEIVSDKILSPFGQIVYIIDSDNNRFDYNFAYQGDRFVGDVYLNQLSVGSAVIYALIRDEVFNTSDLIFKHLEIITTNTLSMESSIQVRNLATDINTSRIDISIEQRKIVIDITED